MINSARFRKTTARGLNVTLDPGHLGGRWAKMEERWFQVDDQPPVEEGELTWRVAKNSGAEIAGARCGSFLRPAARSSDNAAAAG